LRPIATRTRRTRAFLAYVNTQRSILIEWKSAVAAAVASGWTREETIERVNFSERYPVDVGQEYMMSYIQSLNAGSLYDKLTATRETPALPAYAS
jgi:cyclase